MIGEKDLRYSSDITNESEAQSADITRAKKALKSKITKLLTKRNEAIFDIERLVDLSEIRLQHGLIEKIQESFDVEILPENKVLIKVKKVQ